MPAKHGEISDAYVKADKEAHLDIYLQLPSRMSVCEETLRENVATNANELVLDLRKSLYGLKQADRLWIQLLYSRLVKAEFQRCKSDMCFY